MPGGGELGVVADVEQDLCCGPDPDAWHGDQDLGKRVCINDLFDLRYGCVPLVQRLTRLRRAWVTFGRVQEREVPVCWTHP